MKRLAAHVSVVVPGVVVDDVGLACNEVAGVARVIRALAPGMTVGSGRLHPAKTQALFADYARAEWAAAATRLSATSPCSSPCRRGSIG